MECALVKPFALGFQLRAKNLFSSFWFMPFDLNILITYLFFSFAVAPHNAVDFSLFQ